MKRMLPTVLLLAAAAGAAGEHRVMLIGDSISGGYRGTVGAELDGIAVVVQIPGNAGPTATALAKPPAPARVPKNPPTDGSGKVPDPTAYETNLDYYLAHGPFDVIHFNWGLHDLKRGGIPLKQYIGNLGKLVTRMQEKAPGAKLIFATTTPVPPVNKDKRDPTKVVEFNTAALELMKKKGVAVNDLYAVVLPRQAEVQLKDDVHFGRDGYKLLGKEVANAIKAALGKERGARLGKTSPSLPTRAAGTAEPRTETAPVRSAGPANAAGAAAKDLAKLATVTVNPPMEHRYDYIKVGTLQHIDRRYYYCWVPEEMVNAIVYQGVHRAPKGTTFTIDVLAPTTLWVCFYPGGHYSGGYEGIFPTLEGWEACEEPVCYHNSPQTGKEGKQMKRYRLDVQDAGKVEIPATTSENGVMSIVIKAME